MKDKLKIYTEQHRDDFELSSIDVEELWKGVESRLDNNDTHSFTFAWSRLLKIAAILLLIGTVGFGFYLNTQRLSIEKNGIALHNISKDLADTEAFYTMQIDDKLADIEHVAGEIEPDVLAQIDLLDEEYQSLKDDLKDNADSEEVINAMIGYYRLKLEMLEKILSEIEKNKDTNGHEEVLAI